MADADDPSFDPPTQTRRITRRAPVPGSRVVVGALLITSAAVATFVAYRDAADGPTSRYAIARRALHAGAVVAPRDVALAAMSLPPDVRVGAFDSINDLVGRRLLSPLDDGDLVQATGLTEQPASDDGGQSPFQLSVAVPRAYAFGGLLRRGDLVDVFVTYDEDTTDVVARSVRVLAVPGVDDRSLAIDANQTIVIELHSQREVAAVVHAARAADVTLVRSTFAADQEAAA